MVEQIDWGGRETRLWAAEVLDQLEPSQFAPFAETLVATLGIDPLWVRIRMDFPGSASGPGQPIPVRLRLRSQGDRTESVVRCVVLSTLSTFAPDLLAQYAMTIGKQLAGRDLDVCRAVLRVYGQLDREVLVQHVGVVLELLRDSDTMICDAAATALNSWQRSLRWQPRLFTQWMLKLAASLAQPTSVVRLREWAVRALQRLGRMDATLFGQSLEGITKHLAHGDVAVRCAALQSIRGLQVEQLAAPPPADGTGWDGLPRTPGGTRWSRIRQQLEGQNPPPPLDVLASPPPPLVAPLSLVRPAVQQIASLLATGDVSLRDLVERVLSPVGNALSPLQLAALLDHETVKAQDWAVAALQKRDYTSVKDEAYVGAMARLVGQGQGGLGRASQGAKTLALRYFGDVDVRTPEWRDDLIVLALDDRDEVVSGLAKTILGGKAHSPPRLMGWLVHERLGVRKWADEKVQDCFLDEASPGQVAGFAESIMHLIPSLGVRPLLGSGSEAVAKAAQKVLLAQLKPKVRSKAAVRAQSVVMQKLVLWHEAEDIEVRQWASEELDKAPLALRRALVKRPKESRDSAARGATLLVQLLEDRLDGSESGSILEALTMVQASMTDEASVRGLIEWLGDDSERVWQWAVLAVGRLNPSVLSSSVGELAKHIERKIEDTIETPRGETQTQTQAALGLPKGETRVHIKRTRPSAVRCAALHALTSCGTAEPQVLRKYRNKMASLLDDDDADVQFAALDALAMLFRDEPLKLKQHLDLVARKLKDGCAPHRTR